MSFERCFRRERGSMDFESKSVLRPINRRVVLLAKNRFFDPRQCDRSSAVRLLRPSEMIVGATTTLRILQACRLEWRSLATWNQMKKLCVFT